MSLGSKKGRFRASATWWAWPFWNFLIKEFQGSAAPSNSNLGFQVEWRTLAECLASLLSTKDSHVLSLVIFCCFRSFGRAISPSSVSFSFLFFLCKFGLGSRSNREGGRGGWKIRGELSLWGLLGWRPLAPPGEEIFQTFPRVQGHIFFLLGDVIHVGNYKSGGVSHGGFVKFTLRVRKLHGPFLRLSFLFEAKMINLSLQEQVWGGCFFLRGY